MTYLSEIKADRRFPEFITNHRIFGNTHKIKKIFPEIGLENFSEKIQIDNSSEIIEAAGDLIEYIYQEVTSRIYTLTRYAEIKTGAVAVKTNPVKIFGENRKGKYKKCAAVLKKFKTLLGKSANTFIILNEKTGKITLNIPSDIIDDEKKVLFKRGEGLFRVYQKINDLLREGRFLALPSLDQALAFKRYNSVNIPATESKIVFSSTGMDGAWDIATMSMRGVSSCQTWGQSNSGHLVGSIIDPCTAIMYLTSGSNYEGKGTKMMRRCIVRFSINGENNQPSLILERMYPSYNKDIANRLISILKEKTHNKFPVINCTEKFRNGVSKAYIPLTPIIARLESTAQPYRDSGIEFKRLISGRDLYVLKLNEQLSAIASSYAYKAREATKKVKLSDLVLPGDKAQWRLIRRETLLSPIATEGTFLLREAHDKVIKDIKEVNGNLPAVTLQVFDNIFTNNMIEDFSNKVINFCIKYNKIKISSNYQSLLKSKIKDCIVNEVEKDRLKLINKVEKTKDSKILDYPSNETISLIEKVS